VNFLAKLQARMSLSRELLKDEIVTDFKKKSLPGYSEFLTRLCNMFIEIRRTTETASLIELN